MSEALLPLLLFVLVLGCLPWLVNWARRRWMPGATGAAGALRVVSAVAVGPRQRIVMLEFGPVERRLHLTVGVTEQAITRLHLGPAVPSATVGASPAETTPREAAGLA